MPYKIRKIKCLNCGETKCYKVYNPETKQVFAKCSTLENAKRQKRLLTAIDFGWKPNQKKL